MLLTDLPEFCRLFQCTQFFFDLSLIDFQYFDDSVCRWLGRIL